MVTGVPEEAAGVTMFALVVGYSRINAQMSAADMSRDIPVI